MIDNELVGVAETIAQSAGEGRAEMLLIQMLGDHRRSVLRAAVFPRGNGDPDATWHIKPGECGHCGDQELRPLLGEEMGTINTEKRKREIHVHLDPNPVCMHCYSGGSYDTTHQDWPCSFLREVAEHYGAEL
jgi:hypothetical protein